MSGAGDDMDKPDRGSTRDDPAHNAWFAAQVQAAIDDPRPSIPHHVVMAEAQALIDRKRTEGKGAHVKDKAKHR
ncbi:antitoxin PaaA2 family protein [Klebsiella pneumoniae]|uniref:antitoxin PaaA2 family protein n=1 Tax=Klebsiella pneumoniae TaxID=573 RepID=UPI0013CF9327|nr:addiction module antitoxin [Klebsiella pneumoniae]